MYIEGGYWSDISWMAGWDIFLDTVGFDVLKAWAHYIARIVYVHTRKPHVESLTITYGDDEHSEPTLVQVEAGEIQDDYWKHV